MPLTSVSQQSSIRFSEVQSLLTYIKAQTPAPPTGLPQPVPSDLAILRGLFFVHLYAAFEYSIVEIVKAVAAVINGRGIRVGHLQTGIYPLALEPELTAIKDAGPKTKWEKRSGLFEMQASTNVVRLHEGIMLQDLQNVDGQVVEFDFQPLCFAGLAAQECSDWRVLERNKIEQEFHRAWPGKSDRGAEKNADRC